MIAHTPDSMRRLRPLLTFGLLCGLASLPAFADSFTFSTGNPDGLIGTLSRPPGAAIQTETADDFILSQPTQINSASFTGLIPTGAPLSSISQVEIEIYHVFPGDSANPPSGNVPTRVNSPGDVEIDAATRDSAVAGDLTFTASTLASSFSVANTVVNGINGGTNPFTGGEGAATGQEVRIDVTFTRPVTLPADHYFFRPEALLASGDFLLLSAPKPIVAPGTPFDPDLQSWIRNDNLAPDWLRIGTDITGQGPFNAAFSLAGNTVPEPGSLALLGLGFGMLSLGARRLHKKRQASRE